MMPNRSRPGRRLKPSETKTRVRLPGCRATCSTKARRLRKKPRIRAVRSCAAAPAHISILAHLPMQI